MPNRNRKILIITIILIMSFIIFYAGHFSFNGTLKEQEIKPVKDMKIHTAENTAAPVEMEKPDNIPAVVHKHISTQINGNKQEINILEVNLKSKKVKIKPALSYDSVFGFEKLSDMASRAEAYAAVNAGFFYEFGQPSGMVEIDGRLITKSSGKYPVFLINGDKAELKEVDTKIWFAYDNVKCQINSINTVGIPGEAVIYTRDFGTDNRVKGLNNTSLVIEENIIKRIIKSNEKADIPQSGALLTLYEPLDIGKGFPSIKEGDKISIEYEPVSDNSLQAYECGSWLVRKGEVVIGDRDEWVGVMTNYDPRTAVGIKEEGTVVLLTVDGRQPGYSAGVTGRELGEFLLEYGAKEAAMLDGGASTEMILNGEIVNRPSFKGQERMLGGGIIVKLIDN